MFKKTPEYPPEFFLLIRAVLLCILCFYGMELLIREHLIHRRFHGGKYFLTVHVIAVLAEDACYIGKFFLAPIRSVQLFCGKDQRAS